MPATSKQQQKLFGLALSVKDGDTPRSEVSKSVLDIVDKMSRKEIEKFAGTKHKGLPDKKEIYSMKESIRSIIRNEILNMKNKFMFEANFQKGDNVRIKKNAKNVTDPKNLGKAGVILNKDGRHYMVKLPNAQLLVSPSDLELMPESHTPSHPNAAKLDRIADKLSNLELKGKENTPEYKKLDKMYKELEKKVKESVNETELKLGVKYVNKQGKEGFIQTGGSTNPKDWFWYDGKTKHPYTKVKKELKPSKDQRKTGFGDYLKQGGRVWDNVNMEGESVNESYRVVGKNKQGEVFKSGIVNMKKAQDLYYRMAKSKKYTSLDIVKESVNEVKIKKGLTVKIKSASDIDKYNFTDAYKKYLKQIAGKTVKIKRAFRSPRNRGFGPLEEFEVEGYELYNGNNGFDALIIDKIITQPKEESVNDLKEVKVHFEKKLKNGNIFQVVDRDTKGMRGTQDKFLMQIVDTSGKVVKRIGSHPSLDGAKKFSNSVVVSEGIGAIALGVTGGILLLKLLKFVGKKILQGIGRNVKLSKEKLVELLDEMYRQALLSPQLKNSGNGFDVIKMTQLRSAIKELIDSGEIKTVKDLEDLLKKASKKEPKEESVNESIYPYDPTAMDDNELNQLKKFGFFVSNDGYGRFAKREKEREVGYEWAEIVKWEDELYRIFIGINQDRYWIDKNGKMVDGSKRKWSKVGMSWDDIIKILNRNKLFEQFVNEAPKLKITNTISKKAWEKTHKDYKSVIDGIPYVLKMTDNGTALVPVKIVESVNSRGIDSPIKLSSLISEASKVFWDDKKDAKWWHHAPSTSVVGVFNPKTWSTVDGYLYQTNDANDIKLKPGEEIFRYQSRNTLFGSKPLIKVDKRRGLVYFLKPNTELDDKIEFESKGIPVKYMRFIKGLVKEYRRYDPYRDDPSWIKAKFAGTDKNGNSFKRGEKVLYYPKTKAILSGKDADKAWREFQSMASDEFMMGAGYKPKGNSLSEDIVESMIRVTERVSVDYSPYKRVHGKSPRGFGTWAFSFNNKGDNQFFTPGPMNLNQAIKWAKDKAVSAGAYSVYVLG